MQSPLIGEGAMTRLMRLIVLPGVLLAFASCGQPTSNGQRGVSPPRVVGSAGPAATSNPTPATPPPSDIGSHEADLAARLEYRGSDFYAVPDPLPSGKRGTLMRLQPMQGTDEARMYRVLYHSTSVDGSDVAVSGTIWIPPGQPPDGGYSIIAWGPGNSGSGDPCPNSAAQDAHGIEYVDLMLLLMKGRYLVAYTDYEGRGTRYPYLFFVGQSVTHSLFDGARAARDLLGDAASNRVIVAGHSLGADVVPQTLTYGSEYADELDVRGVLALEGGTDAKTYVARAVAGGEVGGVMQGISGYAAAYPELDLEDVLMPWAVRKIRTLEASCVAPNWPARSPFARSPLAVPSWAGRIDASTVMKAPFPVFFVVAGTGESESKAESHIADIQAVAARLCHVSQEVRFQAYPGANHDGVIGAALGDYMPWIGDRFAGVPAVGNCGG